MKSPSNLGRLVTNEWEQLQDCAARFEDAWQKAPGVSLASFLPAAADPLRPLLLLELIKTDLEMRWRSGQGWVLEDYLRKFPELGPAAKLPVPLLYEEYRARHLFGDRPALVMYQERFPEQFAQLGQLVRDQPLPSAPPPPRPARTVAHPAPSGNPANLLPDSGYKLLQRIGEGGFGEVWKAEAPGGFPVAIKLLFRDPSHVEAQRELQSLELIKRLSHPFLVQTHAYWIQQDKVFIVMDLADGSLRDRLKELRQTGQHGIPAPELFGYLREAAEALDYLHSEKVLHRDIKPDNILLHRRHAKLADFGLARMKQTSRMVSVTNAGTPQYMAPEMWNGRVIEQTDQYCLAVTYAELRLDRRLFPGANLLELMKQHMLDVPDLLALPDQERNALARALAKKPEDRYPTCKEFAQAMEQALGLGSGSSLRLPGNGPSAGPLPTPVHSAADSGKADFRTITAHTPSEAVTYVSGADLPVQSKRKSSVLKPRGEALPDRRGLLRRLLWLAAGVAVAVPAGILVNDLLQKDVSSDGPPLKQPEAVALPAGCRQAPGAKVVTLAGEGGKRCYEEVEYLLPNGTPIPFVLVRHEHENDPASFYVMRNKVSNQLYQQFRASAKGKELLAKESEGKAWVVQDKWEQGATANGKDLGIKDGRLPVFRVTVIEAYCFARWLGGNLPLVGQWDKAAGRYEKDRGKGPFQGEWKGDKQQIAVNRFEDGPLPVGVAGRDESFAHCRDMAGNGMEWTRNLDGRLQGSLVPLANPKRIDRVVLRGRSYKDETPLTYLDLERRPDSEEYQASADDISFRVVLPLP